MIAICYNGLAAVTGSTNGAVDEAVNGVAQVRKDASMPFFPLHFPGWPILALAFFLLPPFIGFGYIRTDADRSGQPGWLWAVSTLALGWLAVLAYLITRYLSSTRSRPS